MTPTVLGRLRAWRIRRTKRKLAGLRAELTATKGLVNLCDGDVPGALVIDMQSIPREIAELEELLKQLGQAGNSLLTAPMIAREMLLLLRRDAITVGATTLDIPSSFLAEMSFDDFSNFILAPQLKLLHGGAARMSLPVDGSTASHEIYCGRHALVVISPIVQGRLSLELNTFMMD